MTFLEWITRTRRGAFWWSVSVASIMLVILFLLPGQLSIRHLTTVIVAFIIWLTPVMTARWLNARMLDLQQGDMLLGKIRADGGHFFEEIDEDEPESEGEN